MKSAIKQLLTVVVIVASNTIGFTQTPYDDFVPSKKKVEMLKLPEVTYKAYNTDTTSNVRYLELDKETLTLSYYDDNDSLLLLVFLKPTDIKWLSVDPMANGRPNITPYHYCQNNPMNRIDPNGMWDDNFTIDKQGNITLVEKTNDIFDILYTKESWENGKKDNFIKLDKEVFRNVKVLISKPNANGDKTVQGYTNLRNDTKAESLFKFVSKNTQNEWRLLGYGKDYGLNGENMLITSKTEGTVISSNLVNWLTKSRGQSIRYDYHNHPNNNPMFSGSDVNAWHSLYELNANVILKIYTPQNDKFTHYKF